MRADSFLLPSDPISQLPLVSALSEASGALRQHSEAPIGTPQLDILVLSIVLVRMSH